MSLSVTMIPGMSIWLGAGSVVTRIAIAARHVAGLKSGIVRNCMNVLSLRAIPALIRPLIPGDSEYTWWIPWALAIGCFYWFYVRPRRRR